MNVFVAGSSGFIGEELVRVLASEPSVEEVLALSRKSDVWKHPKVTVVRADLNDIDDLVQSLKGSDVLFCCLGTTIKTAGSREAFEQVDYHYVLHLLEAAMTLGIKQFHVISAMGASQESSFFYSRVKGNMEAAVIKAQIPVKYIYRPGLLTGGRKEWRLGERIAEWIFWMFRPVLLGPLRKYRAVYRSQLVNCMKDFLLHPQQGSHFVEADQILTYPKYSPKI